MLRRTRSLILLAAAASVGGVAAGCVSVSAPSGEPTPTSTSTSTAEAPEATDTEATDTGATDAGGTDAGPPVGLVGFANCDDLVSFAKTAALDRVGPNGLDTLPLYDEWMNEQVDYEPAYEGLTSDTRLDDPETGLVRPDIVQSDGDRVVTLAESGGRSILTVSDISERAPEVVGRLPLDDLATGMVLFGDRAVVLSSGTRRLERPGATATSSAEVESSPVVIAETKLTEVSITGEPAVTNTVILDGSTLSADAVGDRLRVVVSSSPTLPLVKPDGSESAAEDVNRQVITDSTLDDWLPHLSINGAEPIPMVECEAIQRPTGPADDDFDFDTVSILDFDLGAGLADAPDAAGLLAERPLVHASADRIYVTSTDSDWYTPMPPDDNPEGDVTMIPQRENVKTSIYAFATGEAEPPALVAAGSMSGEPLNRFAIGSADGTLRVVGTGTRPGEDVEAFLRVLAEDGDRLTEIGSVGGLGSGRPLRSALVFDEIALTQTFEPNDPLQVHDPLQVIDSSDATSPEVVGEVNDPGTSADLILIGDDRLVVVGPVETEDGSLTEVYVALLDMADLSTPNLIDSWLSEGVEVGATFDARAFAYSDGVLVLAGSGLPQAVALQIDDDNITEIGERLIRSEEPTTDCQSIEADTVAEMKLDDPQLIDDWLNSNEVQTCGPDDKGGWGTGDCERFTYDELATLYDDPADFEADAALLGLIEGGRVEVCTASADTPPQPARRVIAVGDTFYILSERNLQANDRSTFDTLGAVTVN